MRIYVVVTGTDQLDAFICREGMARFCTQPYEVPKKENYKDFFRHLTNYEINRHSEEYKEAYEGEISDPNHNTKRTLTSVLASLASQGHDPEQLFGSIVSTCQKAVEVYEPLIAHFFTAAQRETGFAQSPLTGKAFHLLGFDVMFDSTGKAWLLEINDNPSLDITHSAEYMFQRHATLSKVDLEIK